MGKRTAIAGLALALVTTGCSSEAENAGGATPAASQSVTVVTNFYPVQWMAERVGEGVASVSSLTPPGSEPHDLTLDAKTLDTMRSADIVLYLGDNFQPEVQRAADRLPASVVKRDVLRTPTMALLPPATQDDHRHDDEAESEGDEHGVNDPHVWLDPARMKAIAETTADALREVAPTESVAIDANLARVTGQLDDLDTSMAAKFTDCTRDTIVTSHAAFGYLADRYKLRQLPIAGVSPDAEPDPKTLQDIARTARQQGVTTIFFEDQLPADLSNTVAREVGATTDLLSALEFDPATNGGRGDYISVQNDNASRISAALGCRT